MTKDQNKAWRLIGRGSEASVYHDAEHNQIVKRYDRSPIGIAQTKADTEYKKLGIAESRIQDHSHISVPRTFGLSDDGQSLLMEYVPGSSLLWHLTHNSLSPNEIQEFAQVVAEGLLLLNSSEGVLQPDCTLDHIIVNDNLAANSHRQITFIDFGNGSEELQGIEHASVNALFAELVGSTVYECSRPSLRIPDLFCAQVGQFIGLLAEELGIDWNEDLRNRSWKRASSRMGAGSVLRRLFYVFKGRRVAKKVFQHTNTATAQPKSVSSTKQDGSDPQNANELEQLFFVVADFPSNFEVLSNGIHKAVHGLVKGISSSPKSPPLHILAIGPAATIPTEHGYSIRYFPSHWAMVRYIKSKGKNTFTVLNSIFSVCNTLLGLMLCFSKQPYIVAPHLELTDRLFAKNRIPKFVYWHLIEKHSLRCASGIHMLDDKQCDRLKELGIQTPAFASPNGILDSILDSAPKIEWSSVGPVRFHFFGRIETRTKGLDLLLAAVSSVSVDHRVEVFLQGPDCGDLTALQKEVSERGLEHVVHFVPADYVTNPIDIMSNYDVFILPSRFEGFPVAAVEAMVSARAIVMTDVGGLSPIVRKHNLGVVVEPTVLGIEDGMRQVIANRPNWRQDGLKAREYAIKNFRWSSIGGDVLAELEALHVHD